MKQDEGNGQGVPEIPLIGLDYWSVLVLYEVLRTAASRTMNLRFGLAKAFAKEPS